MPAEGISTIIVAEVINQIGIVQDGGRHRMCASLCRRMCNSSVTNLGSHPV